MTRNQLTKHDRKDSKGYHIPVETDGMEWICRFNTTRIHSMVPANPSTYKHSLRQNDVTLLTATYHYDATAHTCSVAKKDSRKQERQLPILLKMYVCWW